MFCVWWMSHCVSARERCGQGQTGIWSKLVVRYDVEKQCDGAWWWKCLAVSIRMRRWHYPKSSLSFQGCFFAGEHHISDTLDQVVSTRPAVSPELAETALRQLSDPRLSDFDVLSVAKDLFCCYYSTKGCQGAFWADRRRSQKRGRSSGWVGSQAAQEESLLSKRHQICFTGESAASSQRTFWQVAEKTARWCFHEDTFKTPSCK